MSAITFMNLEPMNAADVIRKRPGMYIGSTADGTGLAHMVWELVANSLDQHLAGRCTRIDVLLEEDGSLVVDDDGPGIPLVDTSEGPFLELALTRYHTTATLDGHAPHEHVGNGLQGVGLFPLNALSSWLVVDVFTNGVHHTQRFERGFAVSRMEAVGPTARTGTRIALRPDPAIFSDTWFDPGTLARRLRELACLLPALTLGFYDRREHVYREPRGLMALLERSRQGHDPIGSTLVVDERVGQIRVEAAIEWLPHRWSKVESYANIARTTDGGTHADGLVAGLATALREAGPPWTTRPRRGREEAVRRGLNAVVCVRLHDPTYGAPTKSRLATPEAKTAVSSAVRTAFAAFVHGNTALLEHFSAK